MRCLALAGQLAKSGWNCAFAVSPQAAATVPHLGRSGHRLIVLGADDVADPSVLPKAVPDGCDVLVLDGYVFSALQEQHWRGWARRMAVIDDLADRPHDADLLLDQNLGSREADYRALVNPDCRILTGPRYALLRPEFRDVRARALERRRIVRRLQRVLVSFGLTDGSGASLKVLEGIAASGLPVTVDVLIGNGSPHLAALQARAAEMSLPVRIRVDAPDIANRLAEADLCIGSSGSSSWERCCVGLPAILISVAMNQRIVAERLAIAGAAVDLGSLEDLAPADFADALRGLADGARLGDMAERAAAICDGQGVERVAAEFEDLVIRR
jgi:UDP-2,4-diacetamido-2,4,6-trideoxy-beta-L-altropyranose hydrolase